MPYEDKTNRFCGFLDMETEENSCRFLRRFFILDTKTRIWDYYMDNPQNLPDNSSPVGTFNMLYISMVNDGSWSRPKELYCFYVMTGRKKHFFKANDLEDRDGWIKALRDASKVTVPLRSKSLDDHIDKSRHGSITDAPQKEVFTDSDLSEDEVDFASAPATPVTVPHVPYCKIPPIKTGFCIKQGAKMKNWKRRYFTLDEDGLSYFKRSTDKVPIRTIIPAEILEARRSIGIHTTKENVFEVVTHQRVFYVQATSPEDRDSWITAINRKKMISTIPKERSTMTEPTLQDRVPSRKSAKEGSIPGTRYQGSILQHLRHSSLK